MEATLHETLAVSESVKQRILQRLCADNKPTRGMSAAAARRIATAAVTRQLQYAYTTITDAVMSCGLTRKQAETLPEWLRQRRDPPSDHEQDVLDVVGELHMMRYYTTERLFNDGKQRPDAEALDRRGLSLDLVKQVRGLMSRQDTE
jgi:hypothetical protein